MSVVLLSGGAVEKDRTGTSHESFLLMANSQADMEEWIRAIHRAIWAPLGGGKLPAYICSLIQTHRHYENLFDHLATFIQLCS